MSLEKVEKESVSNPIGISVRSLDSRADDELSDKCSLGLSCSSGRSTTTSGGLGSSTHEIVQETMRDVIRLQQDAIHRIRETADRQKSAYVTRRCYEEVGIVRVFVIPPHKFQSWNLGSIHMTDFFHPSFSYPFRDMDNQEFFTSF